MKQILKNFSMSESEINDKIDAISLEDLETLEATEKGLSDFFSKLELAEQEQIKKDTK